MQRSPGTSSRLRGFAAIVMVAAPVALHAQSSEKANAALGLIDQNQCEPAVEIINQAMVAGEPKSFYIAGQLFQYGFCLVQNVPRSTRLYERGALLGDRTSARTLAMMHARGDGIAQSYQQAGRWYAISDGTNKDGTAEKAIDAYKEPDALVKTYIEAVNDTAVAMMAYPREAIDRGVTGTVKVRFDPRFARVTLVKSTDSTGSPAAGPPNRHDFERALLAGYADAIRVLPKPPMSPNVDNSVEREVAFERKVYIANEPEGLQSLPRS